jgi:hypothetical protein
MSQQPRDLKDRYRRYKPLLRYIAVRKFRVPEADAEPLIREALIAVHERGGAVDNFEKSLVAAIRNVARQYWRLNPAKKDVDVSAERDVSPSLPGDAVREIVSALEQEMNGREHS